MQVKKYRPDIKINLQAVQALHGATSAYDMNHSMFVTTSNYLPSARKFAARENVSMDLCVADDVADWCKHANHGIIEDKKHLVSSDGLENVLKLAMKNPQEYIVHAHTGDTMIMNSFAIKLKETKHAALLMTIPSRIVSHDGYEQRGYEVPAIDSKLRANHGSYQERYGAGTVFRAKRTHEHRFWTGNNLFSPWRGEKEYFDYLD